MFTGTLVDTVAVIVGAGIGLLLGNVIPEKWCNAIEKIVGLSIICIGVSGFRGGANVPILCISLLAGGLLGEVIDIDRHLNSLVFRLENKSGRRTDLTEGFITASLMFCVGAMGIVGALNDGLTGNHEVLFSKSVLDFLNALLLASTLGAGVLFSAGTVLVYQGVIACLANVLSPVLQQNNTIREMTAVGSVLIIVMGLERLGIKKLKIVNFVPSIFLPILLCLFMG